MAITAFLVAKNRAYSKLAAAITAGATTLTVTAGEGANFPSTYPFHLTIEDEIVSCTNRSTDSLTIVRAQQGTTGVAHSNKVYVALNITASSVTDLNTAVNTIEATVVSAEIILGDDKFVKFGAGTDAQIGYETADASALAMILALPHVDEDASNVAVLAIGDIDIVNVDLGFFDGVVLPTVAVLNVARDAYISIDSGDINASGKGVYFKAAADEDVEIINLSVGGTPRIYWDETENQFRSTHGWVFDALCDVQGVWVATATWTLPAITLGGTVTGGNQTVNSLGHIGLAETDAETDFALTSDETTLMSDNAGGGFIKSLFSTYKTSAVFTNIVYGGWFRTRVRNLNTQNWTASVGLRGVHSSVDVSTGAASPSTITGASSFYADTTIGGAANDMVLTNYYGLYVKATTLIGNSKLTNDYGIWIGNQAGGATLNYSIWLDGSAVIGSDTSLVLKLSGDVDDYFTFATVSNVPTIYGTGAYVRIGDAATTQHSLASEDDLMVTGKFEANGLSWFADVMTTPRIVKGVTNSYLAISGGLYAAGDGAVLTLTGKDYGDAGYLQIQTPNAAGNAHIQRLEITGKVTTASAAWTNISHTGMILGNSMTCAGYALNDLGTLTMRDAGTIATGVADDDYFVIKADDTGVGLVEVARAQGAADPYFSMGGSQEFKFYNSGVATFGGNVTIADTKGIVTGILDDDYFYIGAVDNDSNTITELLRFIGATDPYIKVTNGLYLAEQAAALADIAGLGQVWVRDDAPNVLMFTDDLGTDFQLGFVDVFFGEMIITTDKTVTMETVDTPIAIYDVSTGTLQGWTFSTGKTGAITVYADYSGTVAGTIKATDVGHGLVTNDIITIRGTTAPNDYNGIHLITRIDDDNFYFTDTWNADAGASDWEMGAYLTPDAPSVGEYDIEWTMGVTKGAGSSASVVWRVYQNTTETLKCGQVRELSGTDTGAVAGGGFIPVAANERIWFALESDNNDNLTINRFDIKLHRLG